MGTKTVLQLVESAAKTVGTTVPTELKSSTDGDSQQWLELVEITGDDIQERGGWKTLQGEYRFTGADLTLDTSLTPNRQYIDLPAEFSSFSGASSLWDDTLDVQANGPLSNEARLAVLARETTSSRPYWWLSGPENLRINIYPVQGSTRKFLYLIDGNQWLKTGATTFSDTITNDNDTTLFDDRLFILGLIYRWRHRKGLSYAEDKADYEMKLESRAGADRGERFIRTAALYEDIPDNYWPGIINVPT